MSCRLRKEMYIILIIMAISLCACAGYQGSVSKGGKQYTIKYMTIRTISEERASSREQIKDWTEYFTEMEGVAADMVIEDSPNVSSVTRVTDFKGKKAVYYPCVSPDGSFIVFSLWNEADNSMNLWKKYINRSGLTRLTTGKFIDIYPTVSPDGKYIYFSSNRAGHFNIWRIRASGGGGLTRITMHQNRDFAPNVSHNGKFIAFHSYTPGVTVPQIWTCTVDGREITQIRRGWCPKWSKNDKKILFIAPGKNDAREVWCMDVEGTNTTQFTSGGQVSWADWAPNGAIVVSMKNVNVEPENYDIWIGSTQLTTNPSDDDYPFFDNKGRLFFRSNRGFSYDIWRTTVTNLD